MNDHNGHSLSTCNRPLPRGGVLYIERLKKQEQRKFIVLSQDLRGFFTHYSEERGTTPCYEDHSLCPGGHDPKTMRQYFLLHAHCVKKRKQVFIYLTPGAAESLVEQMPEGVSLRGRYLTVCRTDADNGRLYCVLGESFHNQGKDLPVEMDAYASIHRWMKIPMPEHAKHPALYGGGDETSI